MAYSSDASDYQDLKTKCVYMGANPVCGAQPGYTLPPPVGLSQGPPADARQLPPVGFPPPTGYPEQTPIGFVRPPAAGYPPAGYPPQPGYPGGQCGGQDLYPMADGFKGHMMQQQMAAKNRGTISPAYDLNANRDAEVIRKTMKGIGTNEMVIVNTLTQRSNEQRQLIAHAYKTMYGKDLIATLKSELGGYLKEAVVALTMAPADYDARSIHKAISGAGTKESWLIEIFCTRSNAEIKAIAESYLSRYKTDLEESIESDTSGHFKRFLVSAIQGNRAELTPTQTEQVLQNGPACMVDRALAAKEAAELYSAGELQFGTDESVFLKVMATRNVYQLRATFEEYQKIAGCHIMEAISKEMSGDIQETFKTLVMTTLDIPTYFAYKLFDAMRGFGTKDTTLIRIVVSRSEIDLANIKEAYKREFSKELADAIKSETSGEYKRLLVAIVRY